MESYDGVKRRKNRHMCMCPSLDAHMVGKRTVNIKGVGEKKEPTFVSHGLHHWCCEQCGCIAEMERPYCVQRTVQEKGGLHLSQIHSIVSAM